MRVERAASGTLMMDVVQRSENINKMKNPRPGTAVASGNDQQSLTRIVNTRPTTNRAWRRNTACHPKSRKRQHGKFRARCSSSRARACKNVHVNHICSRGETEGQRRKAPTQEKRVQARDESEKANDLLCVPTSRRRQQSSAWNKYSLHARIELQPRAFGEIF